MTTPNNHTDSPAMPGCAPMPCSPSSATPATNETLAAIMRRDGFLDEDNAAPELVTLCRKLERERDQAELVNDLAINILDGNADVIDWRNKNEPELLRKLCEHLESQHGRSFQENANVDLPDTAAQDSASKSNNPAVSG